MSTTDLIPIDVRARLKALRLQARRISGAQGIGQHQSRSRGAGLEFAQYRAYEPGDEPRQIDWKLYARSDKFFVREAERDSPLIVWCVIDATASMAQSDAARPEWSRLQAAKALAACVIELALKQGDRFGLIAVNDKGLLIINAGSGNKHRDQCLLELHRLKAQGSWPNEIQCRPIWERIAANHLVLLLSDNYDEACVSLAERLALARREVLNIQILTSEERDFPFQGGHRFRDAETETELLTDAAAARETFIAEFTAARKMLAARLTASGIPHTDYFLDQALDLPLQHFFLPRSTRGQHTFRGRV
jgi:uncharacterized protein (DUF58 family)